MNLRYPQIGAGSPSQQIEQIRGFLFQLVEQLNMENATRQTVEVAATPAARLYDRTNVEDQEQPVSTPVSNFNQIKDLIIKSADIIDAYYTEINKRMESVYVAESEFGTYKREVAAEFTASTDGFKQLYDSVQTMREEIISTKFAIRQGLLFTVGEENLEQELGQNLPNGAEIYGVEIGQRTERNGVEVFNKFARFTSYGMTLYDNNGSLSAYITDSRLNIPNAVIKNSFTRGGFVETISGDGSSVERWAGV